MILLGDEFPNFEAETTEGSIKFHEFLNESWGILFSHPADFTPVCTTELARLIKLHPEFAKRNVKIIALSCDSVENHKKWFEDIKKYAQCKAEDVFPYPIIADEQRKLAVQLSMLDPNEKDSAGLPLTARAVFIVDQNKKLRLSILYPATTGRNFDEILRVVDSLQITDKFQIATPADWKQGDNVMVQPSVPMEEAQVLFPMMSEMALPSGLKYLRQTPQPKIN
ncbi:peroxiredoxin-6 [Onthophagus taurus]|uniref:peroxiredoxin-6 n=1 Tax=Onthophagus taurus TaxID=166361 RepID=UPI000C20EA20|nr:peroxiredoxin-6 [Onthophagus taurus]